MTAREYESLLTLESGDSRQTFVMTVRTTYLDREIVEKRCPNSVGGDGYALPLAGFGKPAVENSFIAWRACGESDAHASGGLRVDHFASRIKVFSAPRDSQSHIRTDRKWSRCPGKAAELTE